MALPHGEAALLVVNVTVWSPVAWVLVLGLLLTSWETSGKVLIFLCKSESSAAS